MTAPERPQTTLGELHTGLFAFLDRVLAEDLAAAVRRGDEPEQRYLRQTIAIIDDIRADLTEDPRHAAEIDRFLCRTAVAYRSRPGFDGAWLLLA